MKLKMDENSATTPFSYPDNNETSLSMVLESKEHPDRYSESSLIILAVFIGLMSVFGILANGTTIYVIYNSSKLRSVFNYFLLSLAVSDLMSAVVSPLYLYRVTVGFSEWKLPAFLCPLFWSVDNGTSVLTSLHITIFSILRFISLKFPHNFKRLTPQHAKNVITLLWIISIGGGFVPFILWIGIKYWTEIAYFTPVCSVKNLKAYRQWFQYLIYGNTIFFYIPFVLIILFTCGAVAVLISRRVERVKKFRQNNGDHQTEMNRQKQESRAILQLLLIVLSYLMGYLPFCVYNLYGLIQGRNKRDPISVFRITMTFHLMLRISECLNPIFYNIASSTIRSETLKFLRKLFHYCRKKGSRAPIGQVAV